MHSAVGSRRSVWLAAMVAIGWLGLGCLATAESRRTPQGGQAYAGEATCLTCHDAQTKGYHTSLHGRAGNAKTPRAGQGCESCHGPGKAHADAGGDRALIRSYASMRSEEASATCTSCHTTGSHVLWDGSQHESRGVGCLSCHSVHAPKTALAQLRATSQTELCATCHRDKTAKQLRFNHMPVREGKMSCASCHNVHGTQNVRLLKAGTTIDESCTSCHAEKRGPFLWEHAAVTESCTTCHDAHGTNNDRMLVAKQPFLCQRCHVTSRHPPTIYDGFVLRTSQNANKIYNKSCVSCHQALHGSNAPTGKAFLR